MTGRRPDGYHLLDSLAVFAGACDVVRGEVADDLSLTVEGPFGAGLAGEDNLVLRAARALAAAGAVSAGARLVLDKRLPVASGIGGGSADAAAALRLLSGLWGMAVPPTVLGQIAAELGADVPVCVPSVPARMRGVGELLGTAPVLPPCGMVLVNPGAAVSTPEVFRARTGPFSGPALLPARWPDSAAMARHLANLRNDLEAPAMACCPAIADVLGWLRGQGGCLLARMSGSGATCFGLWEDSAAAVAVAARVPGGWWSWGGMLQG